jgi:hypothetical protein
MSGSGSSYGNGGGQSGSWKDQKVRAVVVFNEYRSAESLDKLDEMSVEDMTDKATYSKFVHYLVHTYKIKKGPRKGKCYSLDTLLATVRCVIHRAKGYIEDQSKATQASDLFFTCMELNSQSESWKWWRRVTAQVTREFYLRKMHGGENMDHSCRGIYPDDVAAICKQLEADGSAQAMKDKFGLIIAAQVRKHHRTSTRTLPRMQ